MLNTFLKVIQRYKFKHDPKGFRLRAKPDTGRNKQNFELAAANN